MKRKLFFLLALILGFVSSIQARTDVTNDYLVDADLSSLNGWGSPGRTDWKTDGAVNVVEFWNWSTQFDFEQNATLPAGYYRLAVNAFYRNSWGGDGTNNDMAWIFAGEQKQNVVALNSMSDLSGYAGSNDLYRAATAFSQGAFSNEFDFHLSEGATIAIGFKGTCPDGGWCILGPVKLYEYTAEDYIADYQAKVTEAEALYASPMNAAVLAALQAAVVDESTLTTADQVINAITTLSAAINNANNSISNYAEAAAILNAASSYDAAGQASYAANETIAAIQTAYNNRSLVKVTSEQQAAAQAALAVACKAQEQPADNCDMTAYIVNPNINGNVNGWTTYMNANGGYVGGPLKPSNDAMEFWAAGTLTDQDHGKSFDYYQTITDLPTGAYTISAKMLNSTNGEEGADWGEGGTSGLYGKTSSDEVQQLITLNDETTYHDYTTDEIFVVDGNLRIGVKNIKAMTGRWFAATQFKLTYARQLTDEEKIEIAKENLNAIITSTADIITARANVGTGVFQIPASALSALSDANDAAQDVYDDSEATESEVLDAIDDLNDANTAYSNATLNTPDPTKRYCIVLKYAGYEYDGKAITYLPNDRSDMGGYNIKYQATPNANNAQAFILTQVEGNTYKMSQTDVDGNTRYICTGTAYSGGNTGQIRTTTDASKALQVEVRATGTDNVFNLYNTEANNYIGSQDAGVYTVNSHIDFTIQEAEKAEAKMVISAIAKMGTFCAPFDVTIPADVKAYTVIKESEKDYVTLTEVENDIDAGTPVLVEYTGSGVDPINVTFEEYATVNECDDSGVFKGVFEKANVPNGANNYILQYQNPDCAFYLVDSDDIWVGANRCYLHLESGETPARIAIGGEDDPMAINAINAAETEAEGLKDGKYLIGGKIVIVNNGIMYGANGQKLN